MKKRFGKADVILLLVIFFVLVLAVTFSFFLKKEGASVVITVEGNVYRTVSLAKDQEIEIEKDGTVINILSIQRGKADMTAATCPDKLCVHQGFISNTGLPIVCLPNKLVIQLREDDADLLDTIAY